MSKVIAVVNQKGGVGKTTTAVNLSASLQRLGKRVLLVDADPQGNATTSLGVEKNQLKSSIYTMMIEGENAEQVIQHTPYEDLIPASRDLAGAAVELVGMANREFILKNALAPLRYKYDYIFIDCPPSLELLTLNALCAADGILIPVQAEFFALEGLSDLMTTVRVIKRRLNPPLAIEGVLLTMYDNRTNLSLQVAENVTRYFGDKVYKTVILRNVRLSEAPSHGKPVLAYDRSSRGAKAYMELAEEFIKKNER